jgi:hypothetical protein
MLHNLSITDRSDYLLKKHVIKPQHLSIKTKHKGDQECILPSELENQRKYKSIVNDAHSKINAHSPRSLEENSAYDFGDLPNNKSVYSNTNSSVARCGKRLSTQSIKFLSRKDLLNYTKTIPVKVDTTISLHQRSEDYIKLYNEINLKKKNRKTDIYYWQGLNAQLKKKEKQDAINFNKRFQRFYMDKKSNIKKTETKVKKKNRQRKNRAPSWFLPISADDNISVKSVQKKERQPFVVRQYKKKPLVTTTWVDGPQLARINAMKAVSNREYMVGLLENHLLRCRVDGILYMDGPKRQFAKYLEIFGKIVEATLTVCEKIKEWREQLHLTAKINYKKTVQVGKTPPFYWTYMRQKKGNAGKIRTTVNYMNKIIFDVGDLLLNGMAELVGLLGHKNKLLIGPHRANISGDFIKGIRVCPLLLPVPLSEVADGTASPRSLGMKAISTLEGWSAQAPARWYELEPERVRFAARYMLAEENHRAQIKSLKIGRLDALSTVLNDRGRNGRGTMNAKMSDLVAKNVLLTRDFEKEEQVNVALNEELVERGIDRYKKKLMKAIMVLNEGVGEEEILARQEAVENIKLKLRNMNKDLDDLKTRTVMVPVIT